MTRRQLRVHLAVPGAFATAVLLVSWRASNSAPPIAEAAGTWLVSYLYYVAPHLLWAIVTAIANFQRAVVHAGFAAASTAMFSIALVWVIPPDRTGLPFQWLMYWPLALLLQAVFAGTVAIVLANREREPASGAVEDNDRFNGAAFATAPHATAPFSLFDTS